jgi:hypothetical protein
MKHLSGLAAIAALAFAVSGCAASHNASTQGARPRIHAEVPTVLPRGGVNVNNQALLTAITLPPARALSAAEAIKAARHIDNAHPFPARALEARATLIGSPRIRRVPAWVVTFTSPKPVNVAVGGPGSPPLFMSHNSIVLDVVTGKMLFGFFTK